MTLDSARLSNLRKWNIGLTVLHGAQALLILLLAGDFAITVTSTFPQGPPGTRLDTPGSLFDLPIGIAVAVFLLMAAVDHFVTATKGSPGNRAALFSSRALSLPRSIIPA